MRNLLFSLILFAVSTGVAVSNSFPYIPLQPALTGDWYNPDRNGEGLDISLIPSTTGEEAGPPVLWVKLYGLPAYGSDPGWWAVAQGTISRSWHSTYDDYSFWLMAGQPADIVGHLNIKVVSPEEIVMDYYVELDGVEYVVYASSLRQLVKGDTGDEYVGWCRHNISFSPGFTPVEDEQWCPHIYY